MKVFTARYELSLSDAPQLRRTILKWLPPAPSLAVSTGSNRYTNCERSGQPDQLRPAGPHACGSTPTDRSHLIVHVITLIAERTGETAGDKLAGMWKEAVRVLIVPQWFRTGKVVKGGRNVTVTVCPTTYKTDCLHPSLAISDMQADARNGQLKACIPIATKIKLHFIQIFSPTAQ